MRVNQRREWTESHRTNVLKRGYENDSHLVKMGYCSNSGFSGVSLRRKRGKNGVIPSLSRSCKALACSSNGQSERPPVFKPTRIDMLLFDVQAFVHGTNFSAFHWIRKDQRLSLIALR